MKSEHRAGLVDFWVKRARERVGGSERRERDSILRADATTRIAPLPRRWMEDDLLAAGLAALERTTRGDGVAAVSGMLVSASSA
eukprot:4353165-Alexandrium_andersonii.AAC.1